MPCQWTVVGSGSSFLKWTMTRSPSRTSRVGPGTCPLYAETSLLTPGCRISVVRPAVRFTSTVLGSFEMFARSGGLEETSRTTGATERIRSASRGLIDATAVADNASTISEASLLLMPVSAFWKRQYQKLWSAEQ